MLLIFLSTLPVCSEFRNDRHVSPTSSVCGARDHVHRLEHARKVFHQLSYIPNPRAPTMYSVYSWTADLMKLGVRST